MVNALYYHNHSQTAVVRVLPLHSLKYLKQRRIQFMKGNRSSVNTADLLECRRKGRASLAESMHPRSTYIHEIVAAKFQHRCARWFTGGSCRENIGTCAREKQK